MDANVKTIMILMYALLCVVAVLTVLVYKLWKRPVASHTHIRNITQGIPYEDSRFRHIDSKLDELNRAINRVDINVRGFVDDVNMEKMEKITAADVIDYTTELVRPARPTRRYTDIADFYGPRPQYECEAATRFVILLSNEHASRVNLDGFALTRIGDKLKRSESEYTTIVRGSATKATLIKALTKDCE